MAFNIMEFIDPKGTAATKELRKKNEFLSRASGMPKGDRSISALTSLAHEIGLADTSDAIKEFLNIQDAYHKSVSAPTAPPGTTPLDEPTINMAQEVGAGSLLRRPKPGGYLGMNAKTNLPLTPSDLMDILPPAAQQYFGTPPPAPAGGPPELGQSPLSPPEASAFFPPGTPPPSEQLPLNSPVSNDVLQAIAKRYGDTYPSPVDYGVTRNAKATELFGYRGVRAFSDLTDPKDIKAVQDAVRNDEAVAYSGKVTAGEEAKYTVKKDQPMSIEDRTNTLDPRTGRPFKEGTTYGKASDLGGVFTTPQQREVLADLTKSENTVRAIKSMSDKMIKAESPSGLIVQWPALKIAGLTGIGEPIAKVYEDQKAVMASGLRGIFGQRTGVLTDRDVEIMVSAFPRAGDTVAIKNAKNAIIQSLLDAATDAARLSILGVPIDDTTARKLDNALNAIYGIAGQERVSAPMASKPTSKRPEGIR